MRTGRQHRAISTVGAGRPHSATLCRVNKQTLVFRQPLQVRCMRPASKPLGVALPALLLSCLLTLQCRGGALGAEPSVGAEISKPLLAAIKKVSPNATILEANEVDAKSCAPTPKSPTLVRADLNGDGFEDVALLLKTSVSNEITVWQGQELRRADFLFVIFLNDRKGSYLTRPLDKWPGYIPEGTYIDLIAPGKIHPMGAKKDMSLSNPAVLLVYCEKSAGAYVVTGTRVKAIPLSD